MVRCRVYNSVLEFFRFLVLSACSFDGGYRYTICPNIVAIQPFGRDFFFLFFYPILFELLTYCLSEKMSQLTLSLILYYKTIFRNCHSNLTKQRKKNVHKSEETLPKFAQHRPRSRDIYTLNTPPPPPIPPHTLHISSQVRARSPHTLTRPLCLPDSSTRYTLTHTYPSFPPSRAQVKGKNVAIETTMATLNQYTLARSLATPHRA